MARNIKDKIRLLIQDSYDLRNEAVINKLEKLFVEELELKDEERSVTYEDLTYIRSLATNEYTQMRLDKDALGFIYGDSDSIRNLCIVLATVDYLRAKGLTSAILKYKK